MVLYELIKETKEKLDYSYYPEGHKDKSAGLITIDRINEKIDLTEVAEEDYEIVVTADELLRMDQSFIDLAEEEGDLQRARILREKLEENKKKGKYKGFLYYCYASHVIHNLVKEYNRGKIPKSNIVMWY